MLSTIILEIKFPDELLWSKSTAARTMAHTYDNAVSWYESDLSAVQIHHFPPCDAVTAE